MSKLVFYNKRTLHTCKTCIAFITLADPINKIENPNNVSIWHPSNTLVVTRIFSQRRAGPLHANFHLTWCFLAYNEALLNSPAPPHVLVPPHYTCKRVWTGRGPWKTITGNPPWKRRNKGLDQGWWICNTRTIFFQ